MTRPAKRNREQHAETEEDRLVKTGLVLLWASNNLEAVPTNEDLQRAEEEVAQRRDLASMPPHSRPFLLALGKKDPKLLLEEAKSNARTLLALCRNFLQEQEGEKVAEELIRNLEAIEVILGLRRYGGRPKGKRHKAKDEKMETIRRWMAGDRSEIASNSVSDVAKKLSLSRQTVYTIMKEIKASGDETKGA